MRRVLFLIALCITITCSHAAHQSLNPQLDAPLLGNQNEEPARILDIQQQPQHNDNFADQQQPPRRNRCICNMRLTEKHRQYIGAGSFWLISTLGMYASIQLGSFFGTYFPDTCLNHNFPPWDCQ